MISLAWTLVGGEGMVTNSGIKVIKEEMDGPSERPLTSQKRKWAQRGEETCSGSPSKARQS